MDTELDQLADALFSYSLSVLCDQDEAVAAVRQTRRLALRHRRRLRRPELERAWLYACVRYVCLVRMEARVAGGPRPGVAEQGSTPPGGSVASAAARSRLARLAWPEAAGTTPAQREALELAGRHSLETEEIAAVLGLRVDAAGLLLTQAACEVERTAAALAVLAADACPELRRLGRGRGPVLGRALRGELVRHLDDCPTCRGTAEREAAQGPWPGAFRAHGTLPLVHLPRAALRAPAGRADEALPEPRFDRRGFPLHLPPEQEHAAVVRHRAVLAGTAAAVVAAPAVAIWAVHGSGAPGLPSGQVTSVRVADPPASVPAEPPSGLAAGAGQGAGRTAVAGGHLGENVSFAIASAPSGTPTSSPPVVPVGVPTASPGVLDVAATQSGSRTVVTLTNTGGSTLFWTAGSSASWLRLSRDAGTLSPGAQLTVLISVDESLAPSSPWTAQIVFQPSGAVVTLWGSGSRRGVPAPSGSSGPSTPSAAPSATATPTPEPTRTPPPTAAPSSSAPSPGATAPAPSTDTASGSPSPLVGAR